MGGEDFEPDDPCDVLKLEEMKAKVCFVSDNVDKENSKMGERWGEERGKRRREREIERGKVLWVERRGRDARERGRERRGGGKFPGKTCCSG